MDERFRELQRQAAAGDPQAQAALEQHRCRIGEHCGCHRGVGDLVTNYHAVLKETGSIFPPVEITVRARLVLHVGEGSREEIRAKLRTLCERIGIDPPGGGHPIENKCPYCGAEPDQMCVTKSGRRATIFHVGRQYVGCRIFEYESALRHDDDFYDDDYDDYYVY